MPTIEANVQHWNHYDWSRRGEEWSEVWGGAAEQWFGTILPRIRHFIPCETILEIAPGFGRWTQYLADHCDRLVGVDVSERCVQACRQRFGENRRTHFETNDGQSLPMVQSGSIDLIFSFDSLVHVEAEPIQAYLKEARRSLRPGGFGFFHHSNAAALRKHDEGFVNKHWRAESVSAEWFRLACQQAGLHCISQEIINWGGEDLSDCFSAFQPAEESNSETVVTINSGFMAEAEAVGRRAAAWSHQAYCGRERKQRPAASPVARALRWLFQ